MICPNSPNHQMESKLIRLRGNARVFFDDYYACRQCGNTFGIMNGNINYYYYFNYNEGGLHGHNWDPNLESKTTIDGFTFPFLPMKEFSKSEIMRIFSKAKKMKIFQ